MGRFSPASTGLDKPSEFPELGSSYKASSMKAATWYFSVKGNELARDGDDIGLRLIAACAWHLHTAKRLLDNCGLLLPPEAAQARPRSRETGVLDVSCVCFQLLPLRGGRAEPPDPALADLAAHCCPLRRERVEVV